MSKKSNRNRFKSYNNGEPESIVNKEVIPEVTVTNTELETEPQSENILEDTSSEVLTPEDTTDLIAETFEELSEETPEVLKQTSDQLIGAKNKEEVINTEPLNTHVDEAPKTEIKEIPTPEPVKETPKIEAPKPETPKPVVKPTENRAIPAPHQRPQVQPKKEEPKPTSTYPVKKTREEILREVINRSNKAGQNNTKPVIKRSSTYQIIFCTNPSPLQFNKITNQLRKINEFYEVDGVGTIKGRSFSTNDAAIAEKKRLAGKGLKPSIRIV